MAHQAMAQWAGREMRLDPFQLPHKVTSDRDRHFSYTVDRNGAVMKRNLTCGLPLSIALPSRSFKGIAARTVERQDGNMEVSLELYHHDPDCCLPLLISSNLDDIAADWHAWSRMLRLPMLIIGQDDQPSEISRKLGEIMVETPIARRKRFSFIKHRPAFLRRRKPGTVGPVVKLTANEIIARR